MRKIKRNIICAWILLICFAAGQTMVFSHQHIKSASYSVVNKGMVKASLKERCDLCDTMHHTSMLVEQHVYFTPFSVSDYVYKVSEHNFIPISLILAAGRAPPIS